jgi:hypothetical protein
VLDFSASAYGSYGVNLIGQKAHHGGLLMEPDFRLISVRNEQNYRIGIAVSDCIFNCRRVRNMRCVYKMKLGELVFGLYIARSIISTSSDIIITVRIYTI